MANITLELNIYSAKDLENVNLITKMDVYAVVWINGDDSQKDHKEKTAIDRTGESEPTWNHPVKFSIDQRLAREGRLTLFVKLVCDRLFGGKDLGEVQVPVLELLFGSSPSSNGNGNGQGMRFVTYQVRAPTGKRQGSLTFSYRFDTPSFKPDRPASPVYPNPICTQPNLPSTAYPPPSEIGFYSAPSETGSYPPPPETGFYSSPSETGSYPPPSESGFYPPLSSIGYPPSSQPQGYSAPSYPYPHMYDSPKPEQPVTVYPPSSSSNVYPPPYHPNVYPPPPDKPGHMYHQTQPSPSFHGYAPPSPQTHNVHGYPPTSSPQTHHGYCYPPTSSPQSHHGHGYPPTSSPQTHHGHVYPPTPSVGYGYGCPQKQPPPKKNNKPGIGPGLGVGLLGGALGGLLLGDIVSDIGFDF